MTVVQTGRYSLVAASAAALYAPLADLDATGGRLDGCDFPLPENGLAVVLTDADGNPLACLRATRSPGRIAGRPYPPGGFHG